MEDIGPRRNAAANAPTPSEAERKAAEELMQNLAALDPHALHVTPPEQALPELARALQRGNDSQR